MGVCMGISNEQEKNHPDECSYMAATVVTDFDQIPENMTSRVLPAGNYAIFTHKGSVDKLGHTMNYIYGSWLPKSGHKLREAPDLEIYDKRFRPDSEDSELDIYIPIQ